MVLTIEEMKKAINYKLNPKISEKDSEELARFIMNWFGYEDELLDMKLEPKDRSIFYMLEEEGIVTTHREETTIPIFVKVNGKTSKNKPWILHYWVLKEDRIKEYVELYDKPVEAAEQQEDYSIYNELPEEAWIS